MCVASGSAPPSGLILRLAGTLKTLLLGTLLCLSAPTSLIVLGWLMRRMRFVALRAAGLPGERPGWVLGSGSGVGRVLGGLGANIREGVVAAFSLALATAPFTVIWLLSWWAGWENSFSKGYEQAFVGPLLGLVGVAIFCILMIWLPLALAHQAVENRALALFEWRMGRSAVFAGRGLVTFASGIVPGFDEMTYEEIANLAGIFDLSLAAYVFLALVVLRGWSARLYAGAVARALNGPDAALWSASPLAGTGPGRQRSWKLTHWLRAAMLFVIWFGLAAQVFVGQFLNHDWHLWITHPFLLLPWAG